MKQIFLMLMACYLSAAYGQLRKPGTMGINLNGSFLSRDGASWFGGDFCALSNPSAVAQVGAGFGFYPSKGSPAYIPAFLTGRVNFSPGPVSPAIEGRIGYGIYSQTEASVHTAGGLYGDIGAGVILGRQQRVNAVFMVKYASRTFRTTTTGFKPITSSVGYLLITADLQFR